MPINILMPALSPTMEKGNLAKWLKKEGDKVKSGDVIAEIETDKATMEVEAVDEGTIAKILVPEGTQDVPVNDIIAVMAGDGEDAKSGKGLKAPAAAPAAGPGLAPSMSDKQILALFEEGSYEIVPHDGMRRTIAQRLTASVQTVPVFYLTMDCDIGKLLVAREE